MTTLEQRSTVLDSPCWILPFAQMPNGYTRTTINGVRDYTHRQVFRLWHGPIPDGYEVDHRCFIRECANPEHLDACPPKENKGRAHLRQRATGICRSGRHSYKEFGVTKRGDCRGCNLDLQKSAYAARKRDAMIEEFDIQSEPTEVPQEGSDGNNGRPDGGSIPDSNNGADNGAGTDPAPNR